MTKPRFLENYWLRTILKLLAVDAVLVALAWMLYRFAGWFQSYYFSDVVFMLGCLELFIGALGNFAQPYSGTSDARMEHQGYVVQASEKEQRFQHIEASMRQRSFSVNFVILGVLTLLLAVVLTYA
jgi:hypothetical protein